MATGGWLREAFQLLQQLEQSSSRSSDPTPKVCQQQCRILRSALVHLREFLLGEVQHLVGGTGTSKKEASLVGTEVVGAIRRCWQLIRECESDNWLISTLLCEERREHFRDVHSQLYECIELASTFLYQASSDKPKVCEAYGRWLESRRHLEGAAAEDRKYLTRLSLADEAEPDSEEDQALRLLAYMIVEKSAPMIDNKELKFKQHLGQGGYGTVYEAEWLNRRFAVKVFNLRDSSFDREVAALMSNKHPSIVAMVGYCRDNSGKHSLVMERMDTDLRDFLHKKRPSILVSVAILLQLAKGMTWLHSREVIHRDLKPQNVLISGEDDHLVVKIADFGLSRTNFVTSQASTLTWKLGTRFYTAPEVWSSKQYSKRSDVFGYAMICYQILTGRTPYEKEDFEGSDFMLRVSNGLRPVEGFPATCPVELAELTRRCWSHDPNDRPHFSEICSQLKLLKAKMITNIQNFSEVRSSLLSSAAPSSIPTAVDPPIVSRSRTSSSGSGQSSKSREERRNSSSQTSHKAQPQRSAMELRNDELFALVQKGKMQEAFSKALSFNDPRTVWWICSKLEPSLLLSFNLSMVLQLAEQINNDLGEDTAQKVAWLTQAVELLMADYNNWSSARLERLFQQICQNLHGQLAVTPRGTEMAELLSSNLKGANVWLKRVQTSSKLKSMSF